MLGKTRAKQFYADDNERTQSAAVLLHGDGAFSGQGIVYETLDLCGLFDYTVGGTIHLVVNNQVGFRVWSGYRDRRGCLCAVWAV